MKSWKDNNMLLRESYGEDYSDIPEVKTLNYRKPASRWGGYSMPGINNIKQFAGALEDTGYDKFKIIASRCPVSLGDLKDSWMDLGRYGWSYSRTWDSSMSGFNEIYIFSKK